MESSVELNLLSKLKKWWCNLKLRTAVQHLGLLIALMVYTIFGGLVFRNFEHPAEIATLQMMNSSLHLSKKHLIEAIISNCHHKNLEALVKDELMKYETVLQMSFHKGLPINEIHGHCNEESEKWSILKAVFFSSTVLTTIGYGNNVPLTIEGRAFCIAFALVGIPLTLTVIADWGRVLASIVYSIMEHIPTLPNKWRKMSEATRTSLYAVLAICFLFVYLSAGASLFVIWEDWTFFEGFYFCFITMTTIGFGDIVPRKPKYMLLCTMYILIGLALTSTIIELVRRQYAKSWKQLQALSGPLAENLRKLAENAPGIDVSSFQQDLRKVFTVVSTPKGKVGQWSKLEKKRRQEEWEEAMEAVIRDITKAKHVPLIQIVIYETSV